MAMCSSGGAGNSSGKTPGTSPSTGPGTSPGSSSGELYSKLIGTWTRDGDTLTMTFTEPQVESQYGSCELKLSLSNNNFFLPRKVYVKLNGASDPWYGNLSNCNISFGGGHSDTATVTFSSDTAMSISNAKGVALKLVGSYTKTP